MKIRPHLPALFAGAIAGTFAGAVISSLQTASTGRAEVEEEIVTRRLILVDAAGRQRATLDLRPVAAGINASEEPGLRLYDATGKERVVLRIQPAMPKYDIGSASVLDLIDATGKRQASLGTTTDGPTTLTLEDTTGLQLSSATLEVRPRAPSFILFDIDGSVSMDVRPPGPTLVMHDADGGRPQVLVAASKDGPVFGLADAAGRPLVALP
jgi:hypothetical protein